MHDEIRKFSLEGEMADANVVQTKERLVEHLESLMRDYSYVPALDLEPQFTRTYDPEKECFKFTLSMYGVLVEKEIVWETGGIMSGNKIPRYTPPLKSKQSQITVE
jgi:hypothetical protein